MSSVEIQCGTSSQRLTAQQAQSFAAAQPISMRAHSGGKPASVLSFVKTKINTIKGK